MAITSVDRQVDDLHLSVTTEPLPAEQGTGDCAVQLVDMTDAPPIVASGNQAPTIQVLARRRDGLPFSERYDGTFSGCDVSPRTMTVDLAEPLNGRTVRVDDPFALWLPTPDGTFMRCELPACDPQSGQPPDPEGCDRTLVDAVRASDVPRRAGIDRRACAGGFAVVDIDLGAGACPATGDAEPNPCAGQRIDRTFWARQDGQWTLVTFGDRGGQGCAGAELPPSFPTSLCRDLPAP